MGEQETPGATRHRRDIQGLRALAVTSVVLYHAGLPGLSGGFVGVDLFFVISGFLITSLLLAEFQRSSRVSLAGFWARRARRILPASTLVLGVTAAAVAVVVPALQRPAVARDSLWAALFSANWRFARESTDYLAQQRATSPVLHYWSLGVEEQFYLGWPLLVAAAVVVARRRGWPLRPVLGVATATIVVASFAYSVHETAANQPYAFFGTGSRAWQLGLGCLVAVAQPWLARMGGLAANLLTGAGLVGLVWSMLTLQEAGGAHPYPGWSSVLPTVAAGLLIAGGVRVGPTLVGSVLSVRPLQLVGDLSYSWYLWHFPVLVLGELRYGGSAPVTLGLVALSFLAGWASFRFVESPVRRLPALVVSTRHSLGLGAVLVATALTAGAVLPHLGSPPATTVLALDGQRIRLTPSPADAPDDYVSMRDRGCDLDFAQVEMPRCAFADTESDRHVVLLGDSHAVVMFPPLEAAASSHGWQLSSWTKSGCPLADVTVHNPPRHRAFTECDEFRGRILDRVVEARPDLVVMANIYTPEQQVHDRSTGDLLDRRASRRVILDGLRSTLDRFDDAGIPVLLVVDGPASPFDPPTCLADKGRVRPCTFRRPTFTGPERDAAHGLAHVRLLEFTDEVCGAKRCSPVHDRILVYRDTNHLTKTFALTLTPRFESALAQAPGDHVAASADGAASSRRP